MNELPEASSGLTERGFAGAPLLGVMVLALVVALLWLLMKRAEHWSLVKKLKVLNWMLALTVVAQLASAAFQIRNHVRQAATPQNTQEIAQKSISHEQTRYLLSDSLESPLGLIQLNPYVSETRHSQADQIRLLPSCLFASEWQFRPSFLAQESNFLQRMTQASHLIPYRNPAGLAYKSDATMTSNDPSSATAADSAASPETKPLESPETSENKAGRLFAGAPLLGSNFSSLLTFENIFLLLFFVAICAVVFLK